MMSRFWELDDGDKRSTYVVKTYQPNYLLPLAYTNDINRSPATPTQSAPDAFAGFGRFEAKLQLSLRMKVARDLLVDAPTSGLRTPSAPGRSRGTTRSRRRSAPPITSPR